MLIKFFGGRGGGGAIAKYLVDPARAGREGNPPEVLRGDIQLTRELIDSQDRKWTFTTGVISFAPTDMPSPSEQNAVMDDFERLAFAGLDRDQFDITWVRHSHTSGGRIELHFLMPRMELTTGRALNVAPPGWERTYAPLRDAWNYDKGWARPDDPERARVQQWSLETKTREEARTAITSYLEDRIVQGAIEHRGHMISALEEVGLDVPRAGKDYITVLDPESGQRFRLKGRVYEQDWFREDEFERQTESGNGSAAQRDGGRFPERAQHAREELETNIARRAAYNRERYQRPDERARGERGAAEGAPERDADGDRGAALVDPEDNRDHQRGDSRDPGTGLRIGDLDDREKLRDQPDRDTNRLSSDAERDGRDGGASGQALGDHAAADVGGRPDDRAAARRADQAEVSGGRADLRAAAGVGDHGTTHTVRESALRRVRELGCRLRELGQEVRQYGSAALDALRAVLWPDQRADAAAEATRAASRSSDRSLEQADRVHASTDRQRQQVDERTAQIEQPQREDRNSWRMFDRDRGDFER